MNVTAVASLETDRLLLHELWPLDRSEWQPFRPTYL